jgi:hypothetical protein
MSDLDFVRGFGDLAGGRGGIAWSLGGGGAVILEDGRASATTPEAVSSQTAEGWSFEAQLDADALQGAATFRQIAVEAADGATIVCTAVGAPGIPGHSDERTTAILDAGGEQVHYEDALVSTQYDRSGDPTRFGLELWPTDADQTTRAAATRIAASLLGGARSGGAWAGLWRCHTDGVEGIGAYLLWRE